ncbi:MAG: adenylate kinase [Proteobacteria bacterium]|nr:adenylate kinase [Pseudomonadota bacterium]
MIVILTGAPGAGKGTQADLLAQRQGFKKISTGDALRKHIKQGTEIGTKAKTYMAEGKLVPDEVLLGILHFELESAGPMPILLDGYPRNLAQAKALQGIVGGNGISGAVHLDVDQSSLIARISGRRTCSNCGASFHVLTNPSKDGDRCDRCSGELVQRPDDVEDKVRVRLAVYESETRPVLDFYRERGLYHRVDGNGSTEDVYQGLAGKLRSFT